jgi:hypothetical protein
MNSDLANDLGVEALMALIDAVHGPLRNPTQLRAHVAVIVELVTEMAYCLPGENPDAEAALRAYARAVDLIS